MNDPRPTPAERVYAALLELVECKDLKDSLDGDAKGETELYLSPDQIAEMRADYERRKPLSWEAARKVVVECVPDARSEKPLIEGAPATIEELEHVLGRKLPVSGNAHEAADKRSIASLVDAFERALTDSLQAEQRDTASFARLDQLAEMVRGTKAALLTACMPSASAPIEALKLARAWMEEEEGRSFKDVLRIEEEVAKSRSSIKGTPKTAFNPRFVNMVRAVEDALRGYVERGSTKKEAE